MRKDAKRRYYSPLREQKAAATKAAICDAAARLFVQDGYLLTSMKAVAAEAGVGERTVYATFPTKRDLFVHCLRTATRIDGADAATQLLDQIEGLDDPAAVVRATVDYCCDLMEHAGPLIFTIVEASASDPDLGNFHVTGRERVLGSMRTSAARVDELGGLAEGVTVDTAADIFYVMLSSHVCNLLMDHLDWSAERYRAFLHEVVASQILR